MLGCPNLILCLLSPGPIGLGEIILINQRKTYFQRYFFQFDSRLLLLFATKILQSVRNTIHLGQIIDHRYQILKGIVFITH